MRFSDSCCTNGSILLFTPGYLQTNIAVHCTCFLLTTQEICRLSVYRVVVTWQGRVGFFFRSSKLLPSQKCDFYM